MGPAYQAMWGPNEIVCTGSLLSWDVTDRLAEISVPTLIVTGWYDAVSLDAHRVLAERIPDNEYVIFGNSSHMLLKEKEADAYLAVVKSFIHRRST
jgi:pimeloyl-ACP methyl ester carboxylesterase